MSSRGADPSTNRVRQPSSLSVFIHPIPLQDHNAGAFKSDPDQAQRESEERARRKLAQAFDELKNELGAHLTHQEIRRIGGRANMIKEATSSLQRLRADNTDLNIQVNDLKAQVGHLQAQPATPTSHYAGLIAQLVDLKAHIANLDAHIANLEARNTGLEADNEYLLSFLEAHHS